MANKVFIRPADEIDARYIATHVRKPDFDELVDATATHPYHLMLKGIELAPDAALTAEFDGQPVCMWGVTPASFIGNVGCPWMVGTTHLDFEGKSFLRACRKPVMELFAGYDMLVNYVDARNTKAKDWLAWLGFKIEEAEPYGFKSLPYHKFWMEKKQCAVQRH